MSEEDVPRGRSGEDQPDGFSGPPTWDTPTATADPLPRDPVAGDPDDEDPRLGGSVEEPTPTPTASKRAVPLRAASRDTGPASGYAHSLIYSGIIGIVIAAVGLTMVGLRRRSW